MPHELTPISPVQIQGDTLGLYFGSVNDFEPSNWLWIGDTKLFFRDSGQWIASQSSNQLSITAATLVNVIIGSQAEVRFRANTLTFVQTPLEVGLDWATDLELDVTIGGNAKVTFTDGTFEPVTTNDIDLGTSSKEFKDAFFSGAVLASTYESDVTTGTAPLIVASTTRVANLDVTNSDKVDGLHVATSGGAIADMSAANTWSGVQTFDTGVKLQFRDSADYIHSAAPNFLIVNSGAILSFGIGGTSKFTVTSTLLSSNVQVKAPDLRSTIATGTAPIVVASTTVCANLNVDQVDGKDAADLNPADTKGDLILQDASATARLPVGTNGQVLTADSSEALGVKWVTP